MKKNTLYYVFIFATAIALIVTTIVFKQLFIKILPYSACVTYIIFNMYAAIMTGVGCFNWFGIYKKRFGFVKESLEKCQK